MSEFLADLIGEGHDQIGSDASFYIKAVYADRKNNGIPDGFKYVPFINL